MSDESLSTSTGHRPPPSPKNIGRIAQLYAVEKQARGSPPDRRAELRRAHAAPVFDDLERWRAMQPTTISGKSPLAGAIRYALTRMERLRPYLDHGILELDNTAAERGVRAIALGRKNYLFVGSDAGGKAAAIACTLIETAKLNAVDPHAWRANTLARIPDCKITKFDELLPWRWNGWRSRRTVTVRVHRMAKRHLSHANARRSRLEADRPLLFVRPKPPRPQRHQPP
jgi:hypothetical protein